MPAINEILEAELPKDREFWDFHANNYETDIDLCGA